MNGLIPKQDKNNREIGKSVILARVRCGIYTRKSSDEGLDRNFTTLDNQREAAEAYIRSQRHEGWEVLPDRYDDGGFSGGNLERPALKRLLSDVAAGKAQRIVVYKIDRLSRSLLDFARLAEFFEKHGASVVSITQQLDTSTSMGRLTLNMLLSFAQFEREMVSDRTRDKVRAARRKGKWTGGMPPLGYDVAPEGGKLVVNKEEAEQIRNIFQLYAEKPAFVALAQKLNRRAWRRKSWKTKKGRWREGKSWDASNLRRILKDPIYIGRVKLGEEIFPGEHEDIVPIALFEEVQAAMKSNRKTGNCSVRNQNGALLRGLLRCKECDSSMVHTWTRNRGRLYRYYVCSKAQKNGWVTCPTKSIPGMAVENFVVDRIRTVWSDPHLQSRTFRQALRKVKADSLAMSSEARRFKEQTGWENEEIGQLVRVVGKAMGITKNVRVNSPETVRSKLSIVEGRLRENPNRGVESGSSLVDDEDFGWSLEAFDSIWDMLHTQEKEEILNYLIEVVIYDGGTKEMVIKFRAIGIATLASNGKSSNRDS